MIQTRTHGAVVEVVLARPEKRNALTPDMLADLARSIGDLPLQARVLVLSGDGSAFCAGFDLALCKESPDGAVMRALLEGLHRAISALVSLDIPVVIAAHGAAIAGGCALLGGADIIITNTAAKLGYPVARLGVSPAVSAPFLRVLAGDGSGRARMLENGLVSGERAVSLGLAHECFPAPETVRTRALEIAQELAAKPAHAMQATKRWLREIAPVVSAASGLAASLSLVGEGEERRLLPLAWNTSKAP